MFIIGSSFSVVCFLGFFFRVTLGCHPSYVAVWAREYTKEKGFEVHLSSTPQTRSVRGCCRVRQDKEHSFDSRRPPEQEPLLLAPLLPPLRELVRWPHPSTSCLASWAAQGSLPNPIAQHRDALSCRKQEWEGGRDDGLPIERICQVMPQAAWERSHGWVGFLSPPIFQLWREGKQP